MTREMTLHAVATGPRRSALGVALAALVGLGALLGSSGASHADTRAKARAHFVLAKKHYAAGRYKAAMASFRAAGKLRPSPVLTFNIARCQERLGRLAAAIRSYEAYLRARPKAGNKAEVQARLRTLRGQLNKRRKSADPYEDLEKGSLAGGSDHGSDHGTPHKKRKEGGSDHGGAAVVGGAVGVAVVPSVVGVPAKKAAKKRPFFAAAPLPPGGKAIHPGASMGAPHAGPAVGRHGGAKATGPRPAPAMPAKGSKLAQRSKRFQSFGPRRGKTRRPYRGYPPPRRRDATPIYKKWWFWVAIGTVALVGVFAIAMSSGDDGGTSKKGSGLRGVGFAF